MTRRTRSRGSIEELPSGRFRVVVSAGGEPLTGQRRKLTATVESLREAEKALTRLQNQVDEDRHPTSAITVEEAIVRWLDVAGTNR